MPLILTAEETMLVASVRKFLTRSAPVSAFRALRDSGDELRYVPALWHEMVENGYVAPHVPDSEGGMGMGYTVTGLIAEQMGHTLAAAPFLSSAMSAELLLQGASDDNKGRYLKSVLNGSLIATLAIDECSRHAPDDIAMQASEAGGAFKLNGNKRYVIDGAAAGLLIVAARLNGTVALFVLDANSAGVTVKTLKLVDNRNAADISFSDATAGLLGHAASAPAAIGRALDLGRVLIAAELLGMADECFERTVAYLNERQQFGRKIGSFQALQHRAARLYARLELARGVVLKALRSFDENERDLSAHASLAKAVLTKTSRDTLVEAVQMHGGVGVTDDYDIGLFLKRVRAAGEQLGDDHFHLERLGSSYWDI